MEKLKHKHREGKMVVLENGELKIKSTELVDIINDFRKVESETTGRTYIELAHYDFYKKIKREVAILKSLCLGGDGNISESTYVNSQNKVQPCFELNRDGMLQMLNSESALVRYKTIEYINKLEEQVKGQALNISKLSKELQAILMLDNKTVEMDNRISSLEERMTIETGAQKVLQDLVNDKVKVVLGGKDTPAYKELAKKTYSQCWRNFKNILQVASYKDTPVKDFDLAKQVIIDWQPNRELELMIRGCNAQIRM